MTVFQKTILWGAALILVGLLIGHISSILLPFVVGILVAYFLDPVVDALEERKVSRTLGSFFIVTTFSVSLLLVAAFLFPLLLEQFIALLSRVPEYAKNLNEKFGPQVTALLDGLNGNVITNLEKTVADISGYILRFTGKILEELWQSGVAVINILALIFVSPVVAFYLLRDWDDFKKHIDNLLPRPYAPIIREQLTQIDRTLSAYIRGQLSVCVLLGIFYAIGLLLVGLDFGLFIGLGTGILSFIPYVGMLFGMALGVGVAFFQFGDIFHVALVLGIFMIGQVIEGNFVTPNIVGNKVGLHPVWMIFAMLAGGALFGFTGVLIAIPVAAVIGVLVRFFTSEYKKSKLYMGKKPARKKT